MESEASCNRRTLLQVAGGALPMLQMVGASAAGAPVDSAKFTPIDLSSLVNASVETLGNGKLDRPAGSAASRDASLVHIPRGKRSVRGIPFLLGDEDARKKGWVALSAAKESWATAKVEIPIGRKAASLCLAQFCAWDSNDRNAEGPDVIERVGQKLAEATIVFDDGSEISTPIRRRFEVNSPTVSFGHDCFLAMPSNTYKYAKLSDPLKNANQWGRLQKTFVNDNLGQAQLWIWALENPHPERTVKALRLAAASEDATVLCGLTLYHGQGHPLRAEQRTLYKITLPSPTAAEEGRWRFDVDLGQIVRTYVLPPFDAAAWLRAEGIGFGEKEASSDGVRQVFVEVASPAGATFDLHDTKANAHYYFDLFGAASGAEVEARPGGSRIQVIEREKAWIRGKVIDSASKRPTPVRIAFRSPDGRYIPPYGHRSEVNTGWFEDYGGDASIGSSSFSYIDGTFQAELPVGEIYAEISKGFEYRAIRQKLVIQPSQRELNLEIGKQIDLRSKGWVTADTHVHFLSPSTAVLEAQAEGLNLVNLLAAQWGDLYTNVGDLSFGPLTSPDNETIVRVGTENRQHVLGHIGLLGGSGEPVFPMAGDGPNEAFIGDPMWNSMAEWADACRQRDGVVVAVHFPNPVAELAADIVLGKIDAVELYPQGDGGFRTLGYNDWYRYLNCGYRVTAAGGTDKMAASTPVGGNRTYAYLGKDEFSFANWAKATRAGRTFATTGPLLLLQVDGKMPGDEIAMKRGESAVEVAVDATSHVPIHRLEVIHNGRVVASREQKAGTTRMAIKESVKVQAPGWLAARCSSALGTRIKTRFGIAAHTSPVYFRAPGEPQFSEPALTYMLNLVDGTEAYVKTLATRPDAERFKNVLKVFAQAREHLHQRLHRH